VKAGAQRAVKAAARPVPKQSPRRAGTLFAAAERQADAAAQRFLRGERGLARLITPVPAAAFALPGSAGAPLPLGLRTDLEAAFGADLRAVRVHQDSAAADAARALGAHAFASGAHLFFAEGRYAVQATAGRELIAHEVAHVLQQTGRAASAGVLSSTPVLGLGALQCKGSGSTPQEIEAQKAAFDATVRLHVGSEGPSGDGDLDRAIETARKLLDGRLWADHDKPAWSQKLDDAARDGKFDKKSVKARSFIFECLKSLGFFEQAARLLETDPEFRMLSLGMHEEFFDYLLHSDEFGADRLSQFLGHKAFSKYWPAAILRGWRQYLLHPRIVPGIDAQLVGVLEWNLTQIQKDRGASPPKLKAEHYWASWRLIGELDDKRAQENGELRSKLLGLSGERSIQETLVEQIPWLKKAEQKKLEDPATPEYQRVLANGKIAILDEVLPIWKRALGDYAAWRQRFSELDLDQLLAPSAQLSLPDGSAIAAVVAPLRAPLVSAIQALFEVQLDEDGFAVPLKADEYQVRLFAFQRALGSDAFALKRGGEKLSWGGHVDALLVQEATAPKPDEARLAALAMFPLVVDGILALAYAYDASEDQKSPSFPDRRLAHRARLARRLAFLGRWLKWDDVVAAVKPLLTDKEDAGDVYAEPESKLWLVSDWEVDQVRPIADLLKDFPENADTPILEDTPLSGTHIVEWFRYSYHKDLRRRMEDILRYEDFLRADLELDFDSLAKTRQTKAEVKKAMAPTAEAEVSLPKDQVQGLPLTIPQRFVVKDFEVLVPPEAPLDWRELQASHKKTRLQLDRRATYLIFPTKPEFGVFAWALPPIGDLLAVMKQIPRLARIAKDHGVPQTKWLEAFSPPGNRSAEVAKDEEIKGIKLSAEEWATFNSSLLDWLKKLGEYETKQLPALRRRLVILRRRWLMMNLKPIIEHFAKYPYVSHGPSPESQEQFAARIKTDVTVVKAVESFERFARALEVESADDKSRAAASHAAEVQTALLIIGLSPALLEIRLGSIDGYFKRYLYGFYQLAIDYVSDQEKLAELKAGVGVTDEVSYLVFSPDKLATMKERMQEVMRAVEKELEESQQQRGYSGENKKHIIPNATRLNPRKPVLASRKPDPEKEWRIGQQLGAEGKPDETTGTLYRLVDVYHDFEFHPRAGAPPVAGMRKGEGGPYNAAWLVVDKKRYDEPDLPDLELFKIRIGEQDIVVKANDLPMLEALDDVFLWRSFSLGLEELAGKLETFAQWMVAVVSIFVPEVTMAEFVATTAQMLASGEFDDLIQQLKDDPLELIEKTALELKDRLFRPEDIWMYVLLAGQHSPWAPLAKFFPKRKRKVNASPTTKFGRVVAALRAIGARFQYGLERVRAYFRPPLRRVQGKLAMHPTLSWVLRRAAHLIQVVLEVIPDEEIAKALASDDPKHPSEFVSLLKTDKESIDKAFRERVVELFEGIQHFELPGELINLDLATELIVSFILDRFGPRGKILRMLLQVMPVPEDWSGKRSGSYKTAMAMLSGEIASVWRRSPLDPNNVWRESIMDKIGDKFVSVRDELVTGMYDLVDVALAEMGLEKLTRPEKTELPKTEVAEEPLLPESEGAFSASARAAGGSVQVSPVGGAPLAGPLRRNLQRALGADLSHVRLHPDAAGATTALGADAMTSGSHIFMRPSVSLTSTPGRRLLAHEAAHVVQQTGPRGPEGATSRTPTLGRPALGLRMDPAREAVADLVSRQVAGGQVVSVSLQQRLGRSSGLQPSLGENVVESVLDTLTQANKPSEFTQELEGGRTPEGWTDAKAVASDLFERLKRIETLKFATFLSETRGGESVSKLVQTYVRELTDKFPEMELKRIAQLAQKPKKKKSKDDADTELNPKGFVQLLANYIFANRHVALRVETDRAVKKVASVEIFNLNIGQLGGNAKLWDLAMEASFKGNATVTDLAKAQLEIRQRLRALGPQLSVWDSKHFRFANWLVDEYVALLKARALGKVGDVPPVKEYTNTKSTQGHGLAVSTHGDLTSRGIGAFDRESHHTTQYLLVEFFGNQPDASRQAFPPPYDDFAGTGVDFSKSGDGTVESIKGAETLKIKPLNPNSNRGEGMPTILLSARCHQRGELHILRESRWNDDPSHKKEMHGTATQGLAIENTFNQAIADRDLRPRDTDKEHRDKLKAKIKAKPLDASRQYYSAALATYRWMRDRMIPALRRGLLTEELAYYRGVAAQNHSIAGGDQLAHDYDLKDQDLVAVHEKAAQNNDDVMAKHSWKVS
jgi:hypothetical protein